MTGWGHEEPSDFTVVASASPLKAAAAFVGRGFRLSEVLPLPLPEPGSPTGSQISLTTEKPRVRSSAVPRRPSHKRTAAIDSQHLTGAVALPHQIKIGFGNLLDLADMSDGKLRCGLMIERVA